MRCVQLPCVQNERLFCVFHLCYFPLVVTFVCAQVGTGRSGKLRNKTVFSDKSFMLFAVADESDDFEDFPCRASDSRNEFEDDLFCPSLDNTHGGLPVWMLESSESRPRSELDLRVPLFGTAESMYVPFLGLSHGSAFVPMNQFSPDTTASRVCDRVKFLTLLSSWFNSLYFLPHPFYFVFHLFFSIFVSSCFLGRGGGWGSIQNRCRVQSSTQTSPIFSNFRGIESRHNDPRPVFSHDEQGWLTSTMVYRKDSLA